MTPPLSQLVSQSVYAFLFFKTRIKPLSDHIGAPQNEDKLKRNNNLKNEDDLKSKDDIKNEDYLRNEEVILLTVPGLSLCDPSCSCFPIRGVGGWGQTEGCSVNNSLMFQGTIGFDGTILENDQSWLITMATLTNIPRRAVGIVRLKQPENLGPGEVGVGSQD